jgi:hypothetical protein
MQPGEHDRAAGTAAGRSAKSVGEADTRLGEVIHVRRLDNRVAIAAQVGTLIIGDKKDNVARRREQVHAKHSVDSQDEQAEETTHVA